MATPKLISGWKLWKQSLRMYRRHFWRLVVLVFIVVLPNTLLTSLTQSDATVSAYSSLAMLVMNVTLIYSVILFGSKPDSKPTFRELYYGSSSVLLRYLLVGFVLAIMLVPAALGLGLVGLGGNGTSTPPLGELLLLSLIGLIVSVPSIYLLIRNGLAVITVFGHSRWPGQALRRSRELTQGRFWALLGRYAILVLGLLGAVLPASIVCIGLLIATGSQFFLGLYQVLNAVVLLPLLYIYLYQLHQGLSAEKSREV